MLELLAAIQQADPMSLALLAVIAFAAGMYPVGIMLGAPCSQCCSKCGCESGKTLPEYVTASFSGVSKSIVNPISLLSLDIAADFGSGATGTVEGTLPGTGPIQSVSLTNGGSGYARLNRIAPTLTASATPGNGATFTVTTEKVDTKLFYWKITGITVSGGTGYQYGSPVTISLAEGDVEEVAAVATLATGREAPTLTAGNTSGTGAVLSVSVTPNTGSSPATWGVDSVTVSDGGEDYDDLTPITFTLGIGDVETKAATGHIKTTRVEPTLSAEVQGGGSGATLSVTLDTITDVDDRPLWVASGLTIVNGGTGYEGGETVAISVVDGTESQSAYGYVTAVDENGAITDAVIGYGGLFFKDSGIIESVVIDERGEYFHDTGVPQSVTVEDGGKYYHEDPAQPVLVADVTVTINQQAPSNGSGAVITATIDTEKTSPTFGHVTALTLENGGSGYQAVDFDTHAENCCGDWWNATTFTLRRESPAEEAVHGDGCCWYTNCDDECSRTVRVRYCGKDKPPRVYIGPPGCGSCGTTFYADPADAPFYCDGLSFTATDPFGATAAVSATEQTCEEAGYQCPPCCCCSGESSLSPSGEPKCTQEDCTGQWSDECVCTTCANMARDCEDVTLIVEAKYTRWWCSFLYIPGVTQPAWFREGVVFEKTTTFTLNKDNLFSETKNTGDLPDDTATIVIGGCNVVVLMGPPAGKGSRDATARVEFHPGDGIGSDVLLLPSRRSVQSGKLCPHAGTTWKFEPPSGPIAYSTADGNPVWQGQRIDWTPGGGSGVYNPSMSTFGPDDSVFNGSEIGKAFLNGLEVHVTVAT